MSKNDVRTGVDFEAEKLRREKVAKRLSRIARYSLLGGIAFAVLAIWHPSNYTPGTAANCSEQNWTCTGGTAGTGSVLDVLAEIALFSLLALGSLTTALILWLSAAGKRRSLRSLEVKLRTSTQVHDEQNVSGGLR